MKVTIREVFLVAVIAVLAILLLRSCEKIQWTERKLATEKTVSDIWQDKYVYETAKLNGLAEDFKRFVYENEKDIAYLKSLAKTVTVTKLDTLYIHTFDTVELAPTYVTIVMEDSERVVLPAIDSVTLVMHRERYGFLRRKDKYIATALPYSPFIKPERKEFYLAPRKLQLGLYTGYGILYRKGEFSFGPSVGLGFSYRVF